MLRRAYALALPLALGCAGASLALGCAGAFLALGCAGASHATPLVRARATYELDCPDRDIRIQEELGGWFKAVGCGRKARYRAACDGLSCVVQGEDEPAIPWRDRPPPGSLITR